MHLLWIVFLFATGACIGSFLNVVICRLPREESIVFPASHCPSCGTAIRWQDNIPLVSWLALRGRCRSCRQPISAQYFVIELLTAVLVSGLYLCYFLLHLRDGSSEFAQSWPMFIAHAALLCGLLACSAVDAQMFIVLPQVMWVCAAIGIASAAFRPHPFMPPASPAVALACLLAAAGLLISKGLLWLGVLQESFIDADDTRARRHAPAGQEAQTVAVTSRHGVNPRVEVLRELAFLAPAIALGVVGYLLAAHAQSVQRLWYPLFGQMWPLDPGEGGTEAATAASRFEFLGPHLASGMGAVLGLLVGAAWIWGTRILGTLAFGKEAMGMGDVHILAGVGAVAGWKVVSMTFFAAPIFGLGWALYLLLARGRRELPYGPWLALGALVVMVFYDAIVRLVLPH